MVKDTTSLVRCALFKHKWLLWCNGNLLCRSVRNYQNYCEAKDGVLTVLEPKTIYPLNWNAPYPDACKGEDNWNETGVQS